MKKAVSFLMCMLLLAGAVCARPVDAATARRVAENWLRAQGMRNVESLVDITSQTPFTEFYVFAAEEGGFILISADDRVVPVLGWSAVNRFEAKDMPENVLGWLEGYEQEIIRVRGGQDDVPNGDWALLENGEVPSPLTVVSPMLTTTWDQSPYYNNLCPYHSASGERSVTGCVATATAQVMKYHNHPSTGYGSHTYTSQRTINGVTYTFPDLTADFGSTTYQWTSMPNALSGSSSTTQLNAVATLMYHIGVAVEMSYSPAASGASNYNYYGTIDYSSQTALMRYFKYRPDMSPLMRADYSDAAYSTLLRAELDQQRPILYSGSNTSSGHSFVLDGYNSANQFHINWGWGGYLNGYFTMGSLNPGVGGTGGNSSGTYNIDNVALIGIRPNTNWSTTGTTTVSVGSTGNGTVSGGGTYAFGDTVTMTATANAGYRFSGWSDGSKFNPREIIATGGSYSFTANFEAVTGDTLHYCPGNYQINSYGSTSGSTVWGIKLPASVLPTGQTLTAVQLYVGSAGTYNLNIYTGASHSTNAATASATFTTNDVGQWKTITLGTPVSTTEDIWIVFSSSASYPATYTYGSGVAGAFLWSNSLYEDGIYWGVTAMIRGIFGGGTPVDPCGAVTTFPYSESFDGSLGCWTAVDNNNDASTWRPMNGSSDTPAHGGSGVAASFSWYNTAMQADEYLVSPQIVLPAGQTATLSWWFRVNGSYPLDKLAVKVSTTSNAVTAFTTTLIDITPTAANGSWTQQTVDLSAYAGQTIYLAFHHHDSYDANYLLVDDVLIETTSMPVDPCAVTTFPYSESFDGSLGCWTAVDNNNDASTWRVSAGISGSSETIQPHSGTGLAASFSWNSTAMQADEYLVSPQIVLPAGQTATLSWWFRVNGSYPLDKLAVKVSTTNSAVTAFTTTLIDITPTAANGSWTQQTVDLSAYAGQTIYLAFHHHDSYDANYILVDDIQITLSALPTQYTLTVTSNNSAWGTVTGSGTYNAGSVVPITAMANSGYHFVQWQDGNTSATRMVTVTGNATYTATFEANPPTQYTLTVTSNNSAWGTVTGSGTYNEGSVVPITAMANSGYHFVQWQDGNTNATRMVTVTGNATYTATFEANPPTQYTLTVTSNNSAWGTVTGSGTYNEGSVVPITAMANSGYHFVQWQDGNTSATRMVTVTGNATYTATFEANPPTQYTLTVTSNNSAWGTVTGSGTYNEGSVVPITATANSGYHFVQWQDGNTSATRMVTVTGNATYTATFEANPPTQYTLTVTSNNNAWGTVTGSGVYDEGAVVPITATANSGYHFVQWQDGNTSATRMVTVTGNATYTATFEANPPTQYTLTVTSNNDAWGTVTGSGVYDEGAVVPITATANSGYHFVQWQDGNTSATRMVTVTGNATYTATFEANPPTQYTLTVTSNNDAWGTVTGSGVYDEGAVVPITATANSGYHFVQWQDGNTSATRMVTVTGNATYTATFEANPPTQYTLTVTSNNSAWGTVTGSGVYDEGAVVPITATANSGYHFVQWQDGNTSATRTVTVTGNLTYTATFAPLEGIGETETVSMLLYPNPTSGAVTLEGYALPAKVSMFDMDGREVGTWLPSEDHVTLDLAQLPSGTYFLRIVTEDVMVIRKLIIK